MLYAKFHDHSSVEKMIFEGFYHIWAWWPTWSCDLDHLYIISFSFTRRLYIKFDLIVTVLEKKIFENGGHMQFI